AACIASALFRIERVEQGSLVQKSDSSGRGFDGVAVLCAEGIGLECGADPGEEGFTCDASGTTNFGRAFLRAFGEELTRLRLCRIICVYRSRYQPHHGIYRTEINRGT